MKLHIKITEAGHVYHSFWCPGCAIVHTVRTKGPEPVWKFNDDYRYPTISPSIKIEYDLWDNVLQKDIKVLCHCFIRDGFIMFLADCTHDLKSQTVPIPEFRYE
jgi:hypothetical protein